MTGIQEQVEQRSDNMELARHFLAQSNQQADQGQVAQAVAAAQAAVDILHRFQPPAERKAEYQRLLAEALHKVVQRLIQAGHAGDAAPSAHEAVQMYRQAAGISTGDPVLKIAEDLLTLSQRVADIPLPTEAVTAAQTAVDILHEIQVPPGHEAQYLSLLVATLRTLAQRLTQAGGPEEAT
ncbi:hypothetical protein [Streptomyces olivochromogenes]|uniref:Uncharacterized protein n=1 Tax=Streptomyces olivochromogenes TaxID=1963 RepID=A0A286PGJ0_STROL|nr:hypothetical protein [Streptomyces olivochromogenes]KUN33612.1 hypothetical protein AQJ27_50040 [Streptomyces olivochromogenes]GAX58669.1 hypothetical protein SO3561_10244 [Streptomyces olivochromogenes]